MLEGGDKIITFLTFRLSGGGATYFFDLVDYLKERGNIVNFIYVMRGQATQFELSFLKRLQSRGEVTIVRARKLGILKSLLELMRALKQRRFIHVNLRELEFLAVLIKLFFPSTKVVFTRHGLAESYPYYYAVKAPKFKMLMQIICDRVFSYFADKIIVVSDRSYKDMLKYGVVQKKLLLIPNTMKDTAVKAKEIRTKGKIQLLMVANIAYVKGIEFLPAIMVELKKVGLEYELKLAGYLDERFRGYFNKIISEMKNVGVHDQFSFLGPVEQSAKSELYDSCDIYLSTSYTEDCSYVILEAQSRGLPVVCFDVGGNSFIVKHGRNGCLVKAFSTKEFAYSIKQLADPERYRRLSENSISRIKEVFSPEIQSKFLELIK